LSLVDPAPARKRRGRCHAPGATSLTQAGTTVNVQVGVWQRLGVKDEAEVCELIGLAKTVAHLTADEAEAHAFAELSKLYRARGGDLVAVPPGMPPAVLEQVEALRRAMRRGLRGRGARPAAGKCGIRCDSGTAWRIGRPGEARHPTSGLIARSSGHARTLMGTLDVPARQAQN